MRKRTSNLIYSIAVKGVHIGKWCVYEIDIWLRAECIHAFAIIIDYGLNNIIVKGVELCR